MYLLTFALKLKFELYTVSIEAFSLFSEQLIFMLQVL